MSIRRIPSNSGDKLKDTKSGEMVGSIGLGKSRVPEARVQVSPDSRESNSGHPESIESNHEKYRSVIEDRKESEKEKQIIENEIYRVLAGSQLTGLVVDGLGDRDEMGIYIESPEQVMGLAPTTETYVSRSAGEGNRSTSDDLDLVIYSLRKYLSLATSGNPTILSPLFAPSESQLKVTELAGELILLRPHILSQKAGWKHLGYLDSQRKRMLGLEGQGKMPSRPELVELFGYDVKFASHALRLGLQGIELMTKSELILPMEDSNRARCMSMKTGLLSFNDAVKEIDSVRAELFSLLENRESRLPMEPDYDRVNKWLVKAQTTYWGYSIG